MPPQGFSNNRELRFLDVSYTPAVNPKSDHIKQVNHLLASTALGQYTFTSSSAVPLQVDCCEIARSTEGNDNTEQYSHGINIQCSLWSHCCTAACTASVAPSPDGSLAIIAALVFTLLLTNILHQPHSSTSPKLIILNIEYVLVNYS